MASVLDKIVNQKKIEVEELKKTGFPREKQQRIPRDFLKSLDKRPHLAIIAEVKKASPSKGLIRPDFDPVAIARMYQSGGASAVSVLTDEQFFQGSFRYLEAVRSEITLPVLRKDFIIDQIQVEQTVAMQADAMLLIAAILDNYQLRDLYESALYFSIQPLIEIHTPWELDKVMKLEPSCIGINNRDLNTFITSVETTTSIIKYIPPEVTVVSESGIDSYAQASTLKAAGVRALLVGESLMRKEDPQPLIRELSCAENIAS
jgi:indole-3-glycerol phosphate synthase